MTQIIESRANSSINTLRAALEQAERQVLHLDGSNIRAFLELLDEIEQMFVEFGPEQSALRAEQGRWESLRSRIDAKPQPLVSAAAHAGGLAKLRAQHPPATGSWWHLDAEVTQRRTQTMKRAGITIAAVVIVAAVALWGINAFTPAAGSLATATAQIEELVTAQKLPAALTAVEKARQTFPNDPELLIWDAVLAEQLGDAARAKTSLAQAQEKFAGQPATFWTLVGNHRQQVGDLQGAEQAGQQALAIAPQDADATFLLGSVAEARGDTVQAASYFSKTIVLAGDANPQLGVIAKVRMGYLMQRVDPLPGAQTITQTLAPQSP
jgi:tetratricopeptide (TPR) repeat protein